MVEYKRLVIVSNVNFWPSLNVLNLETVKKKDNVMVMKRQRYGAKNAGSTEVSVLNDKN